MHGMHKHIIPFGPQHPGLKEPMLLALHLEGNYVREADVNLGYLHKGFENILEGRDVNKALYAIERVCGLCGGAYSECFSGGIERAAGIDVPRRARLVRTIIMEIERLQSHLLWLGFVGHEIGYDTLFMLFMRERERILEISELITGARIHRAAVSIGSTRYDIGKEHRQFILDRLELVERNVANYLRTVRTDSVINARLKGVGFISRKEAQEYCLVGPVTRASGVDYDIRRIQPYAAYSELDFDVIIEDGGDALARTIARLKEVFESIRIIREALDELEGEPPLRIRKPLPLPELAGLSIRTGSRVEAPRGELFHFISFKDGKADRIKLRPPTLANITILRRILIGAELGDVPVIVGSLDPCFACMERVMLVRNGKAEIMKGEEFRRCLK